MRQNVAYKNDDSLPLLLLVLSAFVIFDSDYALTSCPLGKSLPFGIFL